MRLELRKFKKRESGQGFVEFALILPLLLFVSIGIMEGGYLLFSYTSVQAASREAARYAAATGETPSGQPCFYLDKAGIIAAGENIISLLDIEISNSDITYDHGPGTGEFNLNPSDACSSLKLGDRVNINVSADYEPILAGLTPLSGFTITSRTSRTILKEIKIYGSPGGGGGGGGGGSTPLKVKITSPSPNTFFDEGAAVGFSAAASGGITPYHSWTWTSSKDGAIGSSDSFSTSALSIGNHIITVQVNDSNTPNRTATDQVVINIRGKPVVTILQPVNGVHFQEGLPITFVATAIDPEDGDITDNIIWKKSDGTVFGNGGSVTLSGWSIGPHTVSAEVTDTSLFFSSTTVSFVVDPELPPVVTITSPADGSNFLPNQSITFTGTAYDQIDGDLTSELTWFDNGSPIPGGLGGSFSVALSQGTHVIEARVEDSPPEPNLGTASITVIISTHNPPTVRILEPTTSPLYWAFWNQSIKFHAEATAWDGSSYSPAQSSIQWIDTTPEPDVIFGTGTVTKSNLSAGMHVIRAQVTDADGVKNWDTITVVIWADPTPVVTITSPTATQSYFGDPVQFAGTASDVPQGNLSTSLVWTSSLMQGAIGSGASFSTSALVAGTHVITAAVTDSSGNIGFATKTFNVKQLVCPTPDTLVVETTGSAPIKAKYSWGMLMPSGGGGTALLESVSISWIGGTLEYINWEGGPTLLYSGTTSTSPINANQNLPLEYTWAGKVNLVFMFSNEPQNNKLINFTAKYRGCPTYTISYLN